MEWPADSVERRPLASLIPSARNARTHSDSQIGQLAASIREWGWTMPVLVDEAGSIIAGHGRVLAAQRLGIGEVPTMVARGWSEAQKRAYLIADNKLTENGGWDQAMLRVELQDLKAMGFDALLTGFTAAEIRGMGTVGKTDPDEVPEPPAIAVSKPGDVWLLWDHRLVCGDATDGAVATVVLHGAKPKLMVTDPPYGVQLDMEWRDRAGLNGFGPAESSYMKKRTKDHTTVTISGDSRADWSEAFGLVPSLTIAYVWHASSHSIEVGIGLRNINFQLRQQIIWVKPSIVLSRQAYNWQHEPCWYAVRRGANASWKGGHAQSTLWEAAPPKMIMSGSKEEKVDHPTQKPVVLYTRPFENHTVGGDSIYEPFSGSGTAIIAAETLGRRMHAIEVDPKFVDVAVLRWQNFTGNVAVHEATGAPFPRSEAAIEKEVVDETRTEAAADLPETAARQSGHA
jgi:DNA modification methylase